MSNAETSASAQAATQEAGRPSTRDSTRQVERELAPVAHTLGPKHEVVFPGVEYIWCVDFSPDGRTAYVAVDGYGVDLWAAGLHRWPAIGGGLVGLVTLVYILIFTRIRSRPQVKGDPHCRRCNYHLIAHAPLAVAPKSRRVAPAPGTRCPECGADLTRKRPRKGRGMVARLWPATALLLACAAGYAWLWIAGIPSAANSSDAPRLWWRWLDRYAESHQLTALLQHSMPVTRVMTVDTQSGAITGCLRTMRGNGCHGIIVSSDGKHLAIAEGTDQVVWVSTRTGWAQGSTTGGFFMSSGIPGAEPLVIGLDGPPTDPWIYYCAAVPQGCRSRLYKWRPRTGEQVIVIDEPAFAMASGASTSRPWVRRYALAGRGEELRSVSAPDFEMAYTQNKYVMTLRAPGRTDGSAGDVEREIQASSDACTSMVHVTPDGRRAFVSCGPSQGVCGYDLATGQSLGQLRPAHPEVVSHEAMAISADGRLMYVPVFERSILVRDMQEQKWIARLTYPDEFIAPNLALSHDGRWLAATPFKSTGAGATGAQYVHELFLFDLSEVVAGVK
jgi:hypothetical protein